MNGRPCDVVGLANAPCEVATSENMAFPEVIHGTVHTPHVVCIRDRGAMNDPRVLEWLGLAEYTRRRRWSGDRYHSIALARSGEWAVVIDSWWYGLSLDPVTARRIAKFGRHFEALSISVGDCDRSFELQYFQGGAPARTLIVNSPSFADQVVERDEGPRLPGEGALWGSPDVWSVPRSMGMTPKPEILRFTRWTSPVPRHAAS